MDRLETATDQDRSDELGQGNLDSLAWLDTKETAQYLRKTINAVWLLSSRGYIRPRKFRRRLYFRRIELDRLLESSLNF